MGFLSLQYLKPDRYFGSAKEALEAADSELDAVIVDLDGVLIEVDGNHSDPVLGENVEREILQEFQELKKNFEACIITNRSRYDGFKPENLEEFFNTPVLEPEAKKPRKSAYLEALNFLGADSESTVMIGDSPVMDIYGANKAGLKTYQVSQDRSKYSFPENLTKRMEDMAQKLFHRF